MSDDFFHIPGDVMREAEAAAEFKLVVPETARSSPRNPETFFWGEAGVITTAQSGNYISPEGLPVLTLEVEATINTNGSGANVGRPCGTTFRICNRAIKNKGPKNLLTMSHMSIAKLKGLMAAIGVEPDMDDGGFSGSLLKSYFPPGESQFPIEVSPLRNQEIYFQVKQSPYETKDGDKKTRAEIHRFLPGGGD